MLDDAYEHGDTGGECGNAGGIGLELVMMKEMNGQLSMSARIQFLGRLPECLTS